MLAVKVRGTREDLQQRGIIARDPAAVDALAQEATSKPGEVAVLNMDGATLCSAIPPEPPEYSIVVGRGRSGSVWQRSDGIKSNERSRRWYPALYREHGINEPMSWRHMIAEVGEVTVLRWGAPSETPVMINQAELGDAEH